jgi:hypothetical protein
MRGGTTVAAMQPYLFPYLGYFQLIQHADLFVIADDFPWVDRGWINRNRILDQGREVAFTVPVSRQSLDGTIADAVLAPSWPRERDALLRRIHHAYARAAGRDTLDLVEQWMPPDAATVLDLTTCALSGACDYVGIDTPRVLSSERPTSGVRGAERAIALVEAWNGSAYLNPPGGKDLYRRADFAADGLALSFLEPTLDPYPQAGAGEFVPGLSILDVILNTDRGSAQAMARGGTVVAAV